MVRVLIADDSSFMRRVLREILTDSGYDVVCESPNGLAAVQDYKEVSPDIVLMDYNMPKLKGVDSARQILKYDPQARIVMVTSIGSKKKLIEALRIGVKNYITKPFETYTLLKTLAKILGSKAPIIEYESEEDDDYQVIGSSFGQYLLQKGVISKDKLLHCLEVQNSINRKIGEIAVEEGVMIPEQVTKILKVQKRINKYFGQLTMQMRILTHSQIQNLLHIQKKHYIHLEEIMAQEKIILKEKLDAELKLFRSLDQDDQGVYGLNWIKENLENGLVFEVFTEQTLKLLMRLAEFFVLEGDWNFDNEKIQSNGIIVELSFSGDFNWMYMLNISREVAIAIAESMIEIEEEEQIDDNTLLEVAGEFVNIVCGNALSKLDNHNIKFEMKPPKIKKVDEEYITLPKGREALIMPILVPEGQVDLMIVGKSIFTQRKKTFEE
ncbi:response regulator [Candidatus Uabimicrobium sp. HlEnr_7]|uniref:response regulator n=1 Tax=Candidatus Uabimicrobium helgolandensis TaxID=3095367 RepID=UPI003558925D